MSFIDHLEELRWHIIRSVLAVLVGMVGIFFFINELIHYVILAPLSPDFPTHRLMCSLRESFCFDKLSVSFQATSPTEQFTKAILIAVVGGFIISFPYIIWELWRFIKPGLYVEEIKKTRGVVGIVSGLFLTGVSFTYFFIMPFTFRFFATFQLDPRVQNNWKIGDIIGLVVQFCLAGGLLFELPVIVYVLSSMGILTPMWMKRYRKHAVIVTLIVGGLLTPSPDVMSQLLLAFPIFVLYEVSIFISGRVYKKRNATKELEIINH
jgi:sec-independent protein translocase protein TatC